MTMYDSVPKEIAARVQSTADGVVIGRDLAQAAARDARDFLERVPAATVDHAFLRYTASNHPAYLAGRPTKPAKWPVPRIVVVVSVLAVALAVLAGGASGALAAVVLLLSIGGLLGLKARQVRRHRQRMIADEQARAASNPWPFGAQRVPAFNPDAEHGSTRVETRLVGLAVLLSEEIRRSPAWNDPVLDEHRVRINLDATLQDISGRAYRVWRLRTETPYTHGDSAVSPLLNEQLAEYTNAARMAENALRDHVAALAEYLGELRPVEHLLADLSALRRTADAGTNDLLRQVYADAMGNQADAIRFHQHADELRDLAANLDAQFRYLREQVARTQLRM
jgi:hypothetical protein